MCNFYGLADLCEFDFSILVEFGWKIKKVMVSGDWWGFWDKIINWVY